MPFLISPPREGNANPRIRTLGCRMGQFYRRSHWAIREQNSSLYDLLFLLRIAEGTQVQIIIKQYLTFFLLSFLCV